MNRRAIKDSVKLLDSIEILNDIERGETERVFTHAERRKISYVISLLIYELGREMQSTDIPRSNQDTIPF